MLLKFRGLSLDRFKPSNLYNAYLAMTPREQTLALITAIVVFVMVIVLPVTVATNRIGRLENKVEGGKKQLKEIMHAIESYDQKRAQLAQMQQLFASGFDSALSTTIESQADTNGIKDKIDSLKEKAAAPSDIFDEASVDVRLRKITLQQLVDFLYALENHPEKVLRLKQLSIKTRYDNKQQLDASFTVSTYRLLEGTTEGI